MDQGPTNRFNNAVAQLIYGTFGNKKYDSHNLYAVQIYANIKYEKNEYDNQTNVLKNEIFTMKQWNAKIHFLFRLKLKNQKLDKVKVMKTIN